RRRGFQQRARQAAREMHALALHVRAGVAPKLQRLRIVAKLDADLLEHGVGVLLDERESFLVEDFIHLDLASDVGERLAGAAAGARRPACRSSAARTSTAPAACRLLLDCQLFVHRRLPYRDSGRAACGRAWPDRSHGAVAKRPASAKPCRKTDKRDADSTVAFILRKVANQLWN